MPYVAFRYTIRDRKGLTSPVELLIEEGPSLEQVVEAGVYVAQLIANLVRGEVIKAEAAFGLSLSGLTSNIGPESTSDVEEGGKFMFRSGGSSEGGFPMTLRLPTFDESFVLDNSRDIDVSDSDVSDFVNAIAVGIPVTAGGGDILPVVNRHLEEIGQFDWAREDFKKSRKLRT